MITSDRTYTRWPGGEGYDRMEYADRSGWAAIPSWGRDGWNLGRWPPVVVYHRGELEIAVDVEGDINIEEFTTREERDRKTDEIAFFTGRTTMRNGWSASTHTSKCHPSYAVHSHCDHSMKVKGRNPGKRLSDRVRSAVGV